MEIRKTVRFILMTHNPYRNCVSLELPGNMLSHGAIIDELSMNTRWTGIDPFSLPGLETDKMWFREWGGARFREIDPPESSNLLSNFPLTQQSSRSGNTPLRGGPGDRGWGSVAEGHLDLGAAARDVDRAAVRGMYSPFWKLGTDFH